MPTRMFHLSDSGRKVARNWLDDQNLHEIIFMEKEGADSRNKGQLFIILDRSQLGIQYGENSLSIDEYLNQRGEKLSRILEKNEGQEIIIVTSRSSELIPPTMNWKGRFIVKAIHREMDWNQFKSIMINYDNLDVGEIKIVALRGFTVTQPKDIRYSFTTTNGDKVVKESNEQEVRRSVFETHEWIGFEDEGFDIISGSLKMEWLSKELEI